MATVHNIRESSREAYHEHTLSGARANQHRRIIKYLRQVGKPVTRKQIALATGIDSSTISPRIHELIHELDLIHETHKDKCPITGITVNYVALIPHGHQTAFNF